jgi:diadenosine tetraphosphatase ApaH/serine/threonine PP2A family protein phosphatase
MRVLVISDIHANLTALDAVLAEAGERDATWCLGDLVGYGPDPNECVERIRGLPNLVCLMGNHDAAALDQIDVDTFNIEARTSLRWVKATLSADNLAFIQRLPEISETNRVTLAHGSPRNPIWEYILDPRTARRNLDHFQTPFCFVGHTHLPIIYQFNSELTVVTVIAPEAGDTLAITNRVVANPGSVGQPRDHDPRASFVIFDTVKYVWEMHRVAYDIASVQQRIRQAGLPLKHALRLSEGW